MQRQYVYCEEERHFSVLLIWISGLKVSTSWYDKTVLNNNPASRESRQFSLTVNKIHRQSNMPCPTGTVTSSGVQQKRLKSPVSPISLWTVPPKARLAFHDCLIIPPAETSSERCASLVLISDGYIFLLMVDSKIKGTFGGMSAASVGGSYTTRLTTPAPPPPSRDK